jgi:hypothetical protein
MDTGLTGISVIDIAHFCSKHMVRKIPKSAVMEVLETMSLDGFMYSTIDDEHWCKIP